MARANLTAMLGRLDDNDAPTPPATPAATLDAREPSLPAQRRDASSSEDEPKVDSDPEVTVGPKRSREPAVAVPRANQPLFLRLERKETRLRSDQYADLTVHARRLSQAKMPGGERITENTLIRVAIDLLLEHAEQLSGQTEAEIKNSVTL